MQSANDRLGGNRKSRATRATAVALALVTVLGAGATASAAYAAPAAARAGAGGHAATQDALRAVVEEDGLPGVAAEARDERGRWFGSAGYADTRTHRERSQAEHFRAASITKVFIATLMLQLEEEGRLDLDDTVEKWLPGVVRGHGNDGRKIRLRQLLNHTSGLNNYSDDPKFAHRTSGPGFPEHRYDTYRPGDLVALSMKRAPHGAPGTPWYSNTNYVLAGMVLEKATGRTYAHEAERRIVRPLGLRNTSFPGTRARMPRPHPVGYSRLHQKEPDAPIVDATEQNMSFLGAAGEVISTTGDLNTFFGALLKGELLGQDAMRQMLTTVPSEADEFGYGLGIESATLSCGVTVVGKTGRTNGSLSGLVSTEDGRHQLAFNINGDWQGDASGYLGVIDAEFCGKGGAES
ncbi:serine hydrolase domain-containing protein [Streptomyces sp. 3N207]|uniref:serine hydrolase domain-containing protein n=1 Tax=Streptomyces sp. 3N207 TaxID=3457417 RepID=UPI003FD402CB